MVGDVGASKRIQKLIVHVKENELAMKLKVWRDNLSKMRICDSSLKV